MLFKRFVAIPGHLRLVSCIAFGVPASSPAVAGESLCNPIQESTGKDEVLSAETPLPFQVVEQKRVKKGGAVDPLLAPEYVLLDVKAVLVEVSSGLSESTVRATLKAILNEVRRVARQRGEQVDGVSAFLYQSQDHATGGSSALGRADWWPKGHSFNPDNVANIVNKTTYVETVVVFSLPQPAKTVVGRLPEEKRRAIFAELVQGEDRARREAETQYPTDGSKIPVNKLSTYDFGAALKKNMEAEDRLRVEYERGLLQRHGLTEQELSEIKKEATDEQWPLPSF